MNRRPLKSRKLKILHTLASYLSNKKISPNQISIASIAFSAFGALCILISSYSSGLWVAMWCLFGILGIQGRLLCNILDGMVAIENNQKTNSGELFNDIPDRIADILLFVATGYAIDVLSYGAILGWLAALLAVATAYIRVLAVSMGAPPNFQGPMAKQHRMALLTFALLLFAFNPILAAAKYALCACLILMILGMILTLIRRTKAAYNYIENQTNQI